MENRRFGLNLLGLVAWCFMIFSLLLPWWSFQWEFVEQTDIFPYIISGPGSQLVGYTRSPVMLLLTGVVILCVLLCMVGSVLWGRAGRIMMGISGVLALLAAWRLLARVGGVASRFGLPVIGHGMGSLGGFAKVEVWTWIQPGLYLVVTAGILAILGSLLHKKIRL